MGGRERARLSVKATGHVLKVEGRMVARLDLLSLSLARINRGLAAPGLRDHFCGRSHRQCQPHKFQRGAVTRGAHGSRPAETTAGSNRCCLAAASGRGRPAPSTKPTISFAGVCNCNGFRNCGELDLAAGVAAVVPVRPGRLPSPLWNAFLAPRALRGWSSGERPGSILLRPILCKNARG